MYKNFYVHFTLLLITCMLMACSSVTVNETVAEIAIEAIGNVDVSYNELQCPMLKNKCGVNGNYQEWIQANGKLACACNN